MAQEARMRPRRRLPLLLPLPMGLLGAIALVACVELSLARWGGRWTNPVGLEWRFAAQAAGRKAAGRDVVCLGDSLLKCGLAADVLEAELGRPCLNLSLTAAPPAVTYFQLRRVVESGARPRIVLLDFAPYLLDWDPRFCEALLPQALGVRDAADLAWATRDSALFGSVALARLLPSLRDRQGLRDRCRSAMFRRPDGDAVLLQGARNASDGPHARHLPAGRALVEFELYPPAWSCGAENVAYVERTLALADAHAITVFWVVPPFSARAHERRGRLGLDDLYTQFVREVQSRHPGLVVSDGRSMRFPESFHADPAHLSREGARAFTIALAGVVKRQRLGQQTLSRWVMLPEASDSVLADRAEIGPRRGLAGPAAERRLR